MKSKNNLIELPVSEWVTLRNMYLKDWPEYNTEYYSIDNAINLMAKAPEQYGKFLQIFTLNGDWQKDGTFVLLIDKHQNGIFIGTLDENIDRLKSAVELLDPTINWYFYACVDKVKPAVHHYANLHNVTYTTPHPCVFHYLRKEDAIKLEIPKRDDVILKPLSVEDANTVNEIWPHRSVNSVEFVKRLILTDLTVGAFDKESGELMAWCLRLPIGALGLLQVKSEYYRRGLGRLVTIAQAKQMGEHGYDSSATILFNNKASRALFTGIGFCEMGERSWMFEESMAANTKKNPSNEGH